MKSIQFPKVFDVYEYCSEELKKSLDVGREFESKLRAEEDERKLEGKDEEMKDETAEQRASNAKSRAAAREEEKER